MVAGSVQENIAVHHKVLELDWDLLNDFDDLFELEDKLGRLLPSAETAGYTGVDTNYTLDYSLTLELQTGISAELDIQQASPKESKTIVESLPATFANPWLVVPARLQTYLPCGMRRLMAVAPWHLLVHTVLEGERLARCGLAAAESLLANGIHMEHFLVERELERRQD